MSEDLQRQRRRRARLTTVALTLLALAIYGGFILMSVHRSHG
jgi:cytochrome c-type biogenesis protein CcmE